MPARTAKATAPTATAYSYLRFSSPEQSKGDSLRRQVELRDAWLKRSGAALDTSLSLRDEGVSAFTGGHRNNPDRHALAAFLELVRRDRIQRGSYLIVESLDRLSREHIRPALTLLLNLIEAGIRVVQLLPVETVYDESVEPMQLLMAVMELSRGHSESRMKSERVGRAWREKKRTAGESGPITKRVPSWLRVEGNRFVVDREAADTIRRIFRMAADGYGIGVIVKRLNADRVPVIGRASHWARSYVAKLLGNRAVTGEYQPFTGRGGKRRVDGVPIPNYYPAIIPEDQWHATRAAMASRLLKGGRAPQRFNLFANLLRDARDGASLHQVHKGKKGGVPSLVNYRATMGVAGAKYVSFPLPVFERAILSRLREIDPRDVLPRGDDSADRVLALTGKLADVEGRVEKLKAQLVEGNEDVAVLVDAMRKLDERRAAIAAELATAKQQAASPLSEAWGECRSLLQLVESAPDPADVRIRLRSAIRRMVESVWCLFVARATFRLAAVRVQFVGESHRDYLIVHQRAHGGNIAPHPARTWVMSFADAGAKGGLDLRKRRDAAELARVLEALELRGLDTRREA